MRFFAVVLLILSSLLLASCEAKFNWPWLEKKEQSSTENRSIGSFTGVVLEGMGKLVFDPSIPPGILQIQADRGHLAAIETLTNGTTLSINEKGIQGPGSWDIVFRVAPPADLAEITLGGMGSIGTVSPLKTTAHLVVLLNGMGRIELAVEAPSVAAHQNGSGELVVKGKTGSVTVKADGLGRVDTSELITANADVRSDGVGEVRVYASENLKVRAQGLGAVRFMGHPATTDVQTEGLTKVSAED